MRLKNQQAIITLTTAEQLEHEVMSSELLPFFLLWDVLQLTVPMFNWCPEAAGLSRSDQIPSEPHLCTQAQYTSVGLSKPLTASLFTCKVKYLPACLFKYSNGSSNPQPLRETDLNLLSHESMTTYTWVWLRVWDRSWIRWEALLLNYSDMVPPCGAVLA